MTPHQLRVEKFMMNMGTARQRIPLVPTIPDRETRALRARLILEEALETIKALGFDVTTTCSVDPRLEERWTPDLIEIADGCADISVVTIGTLSACGIDAEPLFEEVDKSNLRKFAPGYTIREDGKLLKPRNWVKPDVFRVLREQGWSGQNADGTVS